MAYEIVIPKLGMTMTKGKITEWVKREGDWVKENETVFIMETEKISSEVEALASGFLHILAGAGTEAKVGETVGQLAESEAELARLQADGPVPAMGEEQPAAVTTVSKQSKFVANQVKANSKKSIKASPVAKKIAQKHNLDLASVKGTGPGGRIVKRDIENALHSREACIEPAALRDSAQMETIAGKRVKISIPLEGMRQAIAEHMEQSLKISAQLSTTGEFDMTEMVRVRNTYLAKEKDLGVRISFTDLIVFVIARALHDVPIMNSSLIDGHIKVWDDINIGVAVAFDRGQYDSGLIVPVVRNVDKKSLVEISKDIKELTKRARNMKLLPDDLSGGTFTLTNTGVFGRRWALGTPIINQPQAAILQTGSIMERAVVKNGQIMACPMMPISLTFDHRILDGSPVGRFLNRLMELMEDLTLMFV